MPHMDLKRAQELMKKRGIDVLIASTEQNFYYASECKARLASYGLLVTVVPADPALAPAMIVNSLLEMPARQKSYIQDIRSYPLWVGFVEADDIIKGEAKRPPTKPPEQSSLEDVIGMLSDILKEKGLHDSTIGIEKNLFTVPAYSLLSSQNPRAKFVEAESIFWELRKVKTEDEIKALRVAADLGVKGLQAVIKGDVLDANMGELHLRYKRGVLEAATSANALDLESIHAIISSGDHFSTVGSPEYRVAKGDIILIDNGVTVFGYTSDMGRTFVVGKPNDLQKKIYAALRVGYEEGLTRVKPRVKIREVYRAIQETINKSGLDWHARGHMGHMVGIGPGEQPPWVSPNEETELEPNMVMTLEIGTYVAGRFGAFQIEDLILVTPEGYEVLTKLPRDMVEL